MRGLILLLTCLFSGALHADIQQRIAIFTQQSDYFRQICFLPDGTFAADTIFFDVRSSIAETAMDCNAQALALREEYNQIETQATSDICPATLEVSNQGLIDLLNGNTPIVEELACPGIGSVAECANNLGCNLIRSIMPLGAAAARYVSDHPILSSCDGTGSCFTNFGKAVFDNLWDTVKGLYDLGSMAANWVGEQLGSLWRSEDATSRRGIAATEATDSELDRFMDNPFGYIAEKGQQFLNIIIQGISSRYGCAEWTGTPHLSECLRPMSWECADCNEKTNMVCGVAGYVAGNFVTNFFTGGAAAAVQLSAQAVKAGTFAVARGVPGATRVLEAMGRGGRIGRAAGVVGGTVRTAWNGIKNSRTVQGILSVAARVNNAARKRVMLYAPAQDAMIAAARGYTRLTLGAYQLGYTATRNAGIRTRDHLYSLYPRLSDVNAGRYANVANPEQYRREVTRGMSPEERQNMGVIVTTDANNQRRVVVYDRRGSGIDSDISFDFNPAARPVVVARVAPPPPALAETTVETIVVTGTRRPAGFVATREEFVDSWRDRIATYPAQNQRYIDDALRGEQPGLFYLDTQNTALKRLNDTLRDKNLVDALGNRYNDMVMSAVEEFRSRHPGIEVNFYSDYKSLRASIRGPPGQENALMAELAGIMDQTSDEFLALLRAGNYASPELIDERWFRAGLGRTSDEANLVTRFSRRAEDTPTATFGNIGAQTRIRGAWQEAELTRRDIARRFEGSPLLRSVEGSDVVVPRAEVFEVVRKNSSPEDIARILSGRYQRTVSVEDAQRLQTYFQQVDQFSPGLLIPSRIEHNLEDAVHGGFSIDFAGVGSVNAEATAIGLASGQTVRDSMVGIRNREALVTRDLDALKSRTETAVRDVLARHDIRADITVSGDDMVVVPNRVLTPEIRREIAVAQVDAQRGTSTTASGMRTSFFREGIPDETARSVQATIGESIEKKLRSRLEGQLSQTELQNTLFAVDMRGTSPGSGGVGLEIVNRNLSPESRRIIERELGSAIDDVNRELQATGQGGSLSRDGAIIEIKKGETWQVSFFFS